MTRFQKCVGSEGRARFLHLRHAELILQNELNFVAKQVLKQRAHLACLAGVTGGKHDTFYYAHNIDNLLSGRAPPLQRIVLCAADFLNAGGGKVQHLIKLVTPERVPLRCALHLDKPTCLVHHYIHVGFSG